MSAVAVVGQGWHSVLRALAMGLLILLAGSTGICEPGDNSSHSKPPGAAHLKEYLP